MKWVLDKFDDIYEIKRRLNIKIINNGIIIPAIEVKLSDNFIYKGGVLDEKGNFINESSTYRDRETKSLRSSYKISLNTEYVNETVIYCGLLYEFYGHVLLETMSRLWYYIKYKYKNYRVIFNYVPRAEGQFKEFFELLEIPYDEDTFIKKPKKYKKIIIPEQASIYAKNWHKYYRIPFDYMARNIKESDHKKVYFTRTKLTNRNPVMGEKLIENIFRKNGYKIFSPERLSLK